MEKILPAINCSIQHKQCRNKVLSWSVFLAKFLPYGRNKIENTNMVVMMMIIRTTTKI
jgi:hypothetical protein